MKGRIRKEVKTAEGAATQEFLSLCHAQPWRLSEAIQ